ncbi:beta-mannosidase [Gracilibacillus saliphilus]|uniref:beta-mannosidase n=1 Tax=Gracilibacillus saliphilus TaxID=543890 RepID=UPI0013D14F4E|nr:glycoside hydrolase family 2 protein [Gracilibacillus saliphilus]
MLKVNFNDNWTMKDLQSEKEYHVRLPASVMNTLLDANEIADPFYRDNEEQALEVANKDYLFYKRFEVDQTLLAHEKVTITFHGIDTIAEITINGQKLATTENMHRIYEWNVKELLVEGENEIHVTLFSPLKYIEEKQRKNRLVGVDHAVDGYQHLRKAHSMYGWDWGPKIPDLGLWRDVELKAWNDNRLEDIQIHQIHKNNQVQVRVDVTVENQMDSRETTVLLKDPAGQVVSKGVGNDSFLFEIDDPQLWWPAGYGEQSLYTLEVSLNKEGEQIDSLTKSIGLRTIEVKHEPDEWGKSFEFIINGYPIFMKGANYIPEDNLLPRTSKERTERLIQDSVAANFNMIRVWGGGHYPEDYFYDLCDRYGIIVWQDFMFACSVYRLTEQFEQSVRQEAIDQIKRIRHHACLGIWCGNNEVEEAMEHWGWPKKADWRRDYIKLFEIILPEIVAEYDPQTFYWSSSPSSGGGFDKPRDPNIGDVHYWEVWHGQKPFTDYRNYYFRFCSEFGFQSFPSMKTIESFTKPEDRNIFSRVMEQHQKNDAANGMILYYLSENFLYPKNFDALLYTSQLLQAEAIKYGVEHWRRNLGRCMGSLYWQLNDCWPVASWSSVDYYGRWKALHYYAKKFYDPILLSIEEGEKDASIYVTNDHLEAITGRIEWKLRDNQSRVIREGWKEVKVDGLSAKACQYLDFSDEINENTKYQTYLEATLYIDGEAYSNTTVIFTKPKHFDFLNPQLNFQVEEGNQQFTIQVSAKAYTKYVEIQLEQDAVLSDNFFDLSQDEPKTVTIPKNRLTETLTKAELERTLSIRSVYHITH